MENETTAGQEQGNQEVDYKALYEKLQNDFSNTKNDLAKKSEALDKASSEVAEYKRKEKANMSEEEKRKAEYDAIIENNKKYEAEISLLKTEKELATKGFNAEESELLVKGGITIDLIPVIASLKEKWLEENTKSVKAELLKTTTKSPANSDKLPNAGSEKSDFKIFQEKQAEKEFTGKVEL